MQLSHRLYLELKANYMRFSKLGAVLSGSYLLICTIELMMNSGWPGFFALILPTRFFKIVTFLGDTLPVA